MIDFKLEQTGCIYLIKNIVTNKYYVGQTRLRNPIIRWKDHVDSAYIKKEEYHLYQSMRKYGLSNFVFQVIEDGILLKDLDIKEKYYIDYYDSYNNGYNNTIGGQDNSWHSKLSKEQVLEIINKIRKNEKSFVSIAKDYDINPSTVSDINNGDTWYFEEIEYPIINKNNKKYFSEEEISDIYTKLQRGISRNTIAKEYNTSKTTIANINNGIIYKHDNVNYPIYKSYNYTKNLEISKIKQVIELLKTTSLSYTKIGEKLDVGRKTVSSIDKGKCYLSIMRQLGYNIFPIRK